ncbi:hypothetical protein ACHAWX_005165 [Stephanocyclus meneghinianus]
MSSSSAVIDVELLIDRLLSASTPSDCLDSLDQLQIQCRFKSFPSSGAELSNDELAEEERRSSAVDTIIGNKLVLRALCSLIAQSSLPSIHPEDGNSDGKRSYGMEVEGGETAACELLLRLLPSPPDAAATNSSRKNKGATTAELQKQRQLKRRLEFISKNLLHFHEVEEIGTDIHDTTALIPSLLDCLCASTHPNSNETPVYARVLSLQVLSSLLHASPGALREQLMKAPDGINRLVDLLGYGDSSPMGNGGSGTVPEEVRNQAILFLTHLASSSSMLARLITFSEGYDRALKIGLECGSNRLTGGSTVAIDCLELCLALAYADDVARELFLGGGDGKGNLDRLAMLMDLRGGERFLSEERNAWWSEELRRQRQEKRAGIVLGKSSEEGPGFKAGEEKKGKSGKRGKQRKDDDLDDILRGADSASTSTKTVVPSKPSRDANSTSFVPIGPPVPYLTTNEAVIVDSICNLLLVLLYDGDYKSDMSQPPRSFTETSLAKRRARAKTIAAHELLTRSIIDCALYTLPPPGVDFVSAVPPPALQQKALTTMAVLGSMGDTILNGAEEFGNSVVDGTSTKSKMEEEETTKLQTHLLFETMPLYLQGRVTAMERLMYLACTGAYRPQNEGDESAEATASLISVNAIAAFRSCLPAETACRMVLHALAPPPPDETEETVAPLDMPVVTKLVTTLVENVRFLQSKQFLYQQTDDSYDDDITNIYSATIGASGAADALGVLLTKGEGDATREMLLRMPPPPPPEPDETGKTPTTSSECASSSSLIDFALQFIASYDHIPPKSHSQSLSATFHRSAAYVTLSLLRLLAEWIEGMPKAVSEVLSSPSSVALGVLVRSKTGKTVPAMSGLLLGLCLEYIDQNYMEKPSSNSITSMENSAWTKETIVNLIQSMGVGKYFAMLDEWRKVAFPLPYCHGDAGPVLERRAASTWYSRSVTQVRRRIVVTLAGDGSCENELDSDVEGDDGSVSTRSLRKMVKRQAKEMEDLQTKLEEALRTIDTQASQIKSLKRVSELGTCAETNDMLAEYADKIAEMEKEKVQIINQAEKQSNLQKEELSARDQEIFSLQEELRKARVAVEERERDNENLSEEMAGLSAAYTSLEQEYRSISSSNSVGGARETIATGASSMEDEGLPSVPGGEAAVEDPGRPHSAVIHEFQVLQEENARLREDVQAANEWMAMAVSKMDEMGRENESLSISLAEARRQATVFPQEVIKSKDDELAKQHGLLKDLRERNEEAQERIASGVTRVETLTKEVEELTARNVELEKAINEHELMRYEFEEVKAQNVNLTVECRSLQSNLTEFQSWSDTAQNRLAEMEAALQDVTAERDELKKLPQTASEDAKILVEALQAELNKKNDEIKAARIQLEQVLSQQFEESEANKVSVENLRKELDHQKQLIESLTCERDQLLVHDESKSRLSEMEATLQKTVAERDELKESLKSLSTASKLQAESLQFELGKKIDELTDVRSHLEQVQSQLIEESEANVAAMENLRNELGLEKQRAAALASEMEELTAQLSSKQSDIVSINADNLNLHTQIAELNQRIDELDAAKTAAESHVEDLIKLSASAPVTSNLEDEIIAITADRNEIKSHFDDISEEYELMKQTLERVQMENGNLVARNRALEQDNKSLEYQFIEASSKSNHVTQLESRIIELEELLILSKEDNNSLQEALDDMKNRSEEVVKLWKERAEELEANVSSLETQMEDQEKEALDAIAQWEARCSSLEGSGESVIQQWQEKALAMEADIAALETQVTIVSDKNKVLENSLAASSRALQSEIREKEEAIASYDEQVDLLTKELIATREESEQVVKQWQNRSDELEASINELNETLHNQQLEATDAISQWEARCAALNEKIEELEIQALSADRFRESLSTANQNLADKEKEIARLGSELNSLLTSASERESQISSLMSQLDGTKRELDRSAAERELLLQSLSHQKSEHAEQVHSILKEKDEAIHTLKTNMSSLIVKFDDSQARLLEVTEESVLKDHEWNEKVVSLNARIAELETNQTTSSNILSEELERLKERCNDLEHHNSDVEQKKDEALSELEEAKIAVYELQDELRRSKEELQSFATDQFSARANEIATHALRQQMLDVRSQYEADRKALAKEKEARQAAEDAVEKLKTDLALLSQATEYDEKVDNHVRKIAKKMSVENTRKERQEMEELRSALEQLKEELGTCRWKEREAEEKAANARLQKSILEQEVCAAKSDMALMEQAIEGR